ncbi:MAG: hypothetical protein ACE5KL_07470 [Alphaproteobacteria bacterium]
MVLNVVLGAAVFALIVCNILLRLERRHEQTARRRETRRVEIAEAQIRTLERHLDDNRAVTEHVTAMRSLFDKGKLPLSVH